MYVIVHRRKTLEVSDCINSRIVVSGKGRRLVVNKEIHTCNLLKFLYVCSCYPVKNTIVISNIKFNKTKITSHVAIDV